MIIDDASMNPEVYRLNRLPPPNPIALAQSEALATLVRNEITAANGWLPFNRYMERVLYTPGLGYYSGAAVKFGRCPEDGSDFITAPELSPFFSITLAQPVAETLAASSTRHVMEFGAGSGKLAAGLMNALEAQGTPFDTYSIIDLSGKLRIDQRKTIETEAPALAARVHWLDTLPTLFEGVIIANEVLDSMPVRLFVRDSSDDALNSNNTKWRERGVSFTTNGTFKFTDRQLVSPNEARFLVDIDTNSNYVTETHEAAIAFTQAICSMLVRGAVFFIDYGFARHEYYHAQRSQGTLMCHYRHRAHDNPFLYPGLQDITAHVEFTSIAEAGVATGADLLGYTSQAQFLINAGIIHILAQIDPQDIQCFVPAVNTVQTLLSEAEMGELFKVIAFSRGINKTISAFSQCDRSHTL